VSIVDNKSTDESVRYISTNFKEIEVYQSEENRVLCSYNNYLEFIDDEIVIFLNNDIKVDPDFVDPLLMHFDHEDIFFVAAKELSMKGEYQGNLNELGFKFGVLSAKPLAANIDKAQYNVYVHGGAFHREKFIFLKGFDDIYLPGIGEDLDVCYRGWKAGWKGLYEPKSFFYHEGSTSFKQKYGDKGKALLAHRNSFLFFWKNVTSMRMFLKHLVQAPIYLAGALLTGRWIIVKGFLCALARIPKVVIKRIESEKNFKIKDEEIMERVLEKYTFSKVEK